MERLTMLGTGIALVTKYQNTYFAIRRMKILFWWMGEAVMAYSVSLKKPA